jgi:cytosine/adenosine deaminase-related metal-dependent hydrolase
VVSLSNGRISRLDPGPIPGQDYHDLGDGLLMPGLVNAHTHLELSGLGGLLTPQGDFVDWLERFVEVRAVPTREQAAEATRRAVDFAMQSGTVLVGDITNTGKAAGVCHAAGLSTVSFHEALGKANAEPPEPAAAWDHEVYTARAVAAHSPYSIPASRFQALKAKAAEGPFAVHLAECRAEMEFMAGRGDQGRRLVDFLEVRGVRRDELNLTAERPLAHLLNLKVVDQNTLLVHGVQLSAGEAAEVAASGASLCVCPRSNLGLTGSLARVADLLVAGANLALGTDSLASSPDLNLMNEARELAEHLPELDPEVILTMATLGGARALGLGDHFGGLEPGRVGKMLFYPLDPVAGHEVGEALLRGPKPGLPKIIGN